MSTQAPLTDADLDDIDARVNAARQMVSALCKRRGSQGARDWIMSIPAQPDYDPDLVIGASLGDIPRLTHELRAARAALREIANNPRLESGDTRIARKALGEKEKTDEKLG